MVALGNRLWCGSGGDVLGADIGHGAGECAPVTAGAQAPVGLSGHDFGCGCGGAVEGRGLGHDLIEGAHGGAGRGDGTGESPAPLGPGRTVAQAIIEIFKGEHGAAGIGRRCRGVEVAGQGSGCRQQQRHQY